jgi:hypothetical protein
LMVSVQSVGILHIQNRRAIPVEQPV